MNKVKTYISKNPISIQAIQYIKYEDINQIVDFTNGCFRYSVTDNEFYIKTPNGKLKCDNGDYIVKGIGGNFYPCKPDIFLKIYELLKE